MPYFTLWMLDFFNTIRVSNSLDPDQARHFVGPDLGPNCLQWLSADIAGKELNTKQLVDTFWLKPWLKLISCGSKVLATTNSEPGETTCIKISSYSISLPTGTIECTFYTCKCNLILKVPITTAADNKLCDIFSNFRKK